MSINESSSSNCKKYFSCIINNSCYISAWRNSKKKKIHGSGSKTLIISDKEINYILKIVPALEDSNILLNGITKTIENETKQQKRGFLGILFGVLGASLLEIC